MSPTSTLTYNAAVLTFSSAGHIPGPCHVCLHTLQKGNVHWGHTARFESGSETTLEPHEVLGQNAIPGTESS